MKSKKRKWMWISSSLVILGILAVIKLTVLSMPDKVDMASSNQRNQSLSVRTVTITPITLKDQITTTGSIIPNEQVEIRSEMTGKIKKLFFTEGARVQKGELLVKINDDEIQAQQLRARYRFDLAQSQVERQKQLIEKKLISQEEVDAIISERNIAQAEMQLIQTQIEKTEIKAPFEGTIGLRFVSEGSYISPDSIITSLVDSSTVKIDFSVPEKYAGTIKPGDKIAFMVQTDPSEFEGAIYAMDSSIDPGSRTLRILAQSSNSNSKLIPGSYADIVLKFQEREAILIPAGSVIAELKTRKVFVLKDGKVESREIETGIRTSDQIEVIGGLSAGEVLIVSALLQLKPGMIVNPV